MAGSCKVLRYWPVRTFKSLSQPSTDPRSRSHCWRREKDFTATERSLMDTAEATQEQPLTLSAVRAEVERWQNALTALGEMEHRLVSKQGRLKKERFSAFAAEQQSTVSELNKLFAAMQCELCALPELRSEAETRLAEAKRIAKGVAVADMEAMLSVLAAQVQEAQTKALATHTDEDIDTLLDLAKQAYG